MVRVIRVVVKTDPDAPNDDARAVFVVAALSEDGYGADMMAGGVRRNERGEWKVHNVAVTARTGAVVGAEEESRLAVAVELAASARAGLVL